MSIVNTQNIKEDYHNQVQEYYANYNLFDRNSTEHFEDFHENYANDDKLEPNKDSQKVPDMSPNLLNQPPTKNVNVDKSNKDIEHDDDDEEDDEVPDKKISVGINEDSHMDNGNLIEPNTNSRIINYIDASIGVLSDMKNFAKSPSSGVSEQCRKAIKIPNSKCLDEIKLKISAENLSEKTKNKISRKMDNIRY
jgi:hypothetical protein